MTTVVLAAANLVAAAAVLALLAAIAGTRRWRPGLAMTLDLLLAAGLLRLTAATTWQAIAGAAAIVAIRHVVGRSLRTGASTPGT